MNYRIRMVTMKDLEAVTEVEQICFPKEEASTKESFQQRILTFPDSFFVAETLKGQIIGFINGCVTDQPILFDELYHDASLHQPKGDYQTVFGLDVIPEFRKQGVAHCLMNYLIAHAQHRGKTGIILTCKDHLIAYYESFGYVHQGVSASTHGGATWNDMLLTFH